MNGGYLGARLQRNSRRFLWFPRPPINSTTVQVVGTGGASFLYSVDGGVNQLFVGANCQQGLLDGQAPASAAET